MDLQPILENTLLKVRPLNEKDLEPLYAVAKDPLIWEQHPSKRYMRDEFEQFFVESLASRGALAIIDKQLDLMIGSSRFKPVKGFPNAVEIGWTFLARNYWGGKYNREAKYLMMAHAFHYVDNIILYVAKDNTRSQKAVEKINGIKADLSEYAELPATSPDNYTYIIKKPSTL